VLIAFGIVVIVLAINGRNTVHDELMQQQITGTPDMTPAAIKGGGCQGRAPERDLSDVLGCRRGGRHRLGGALLLAVHEHSRA
jgi:hypothetical protein